MRWRLAPHALKHGQEIGEPRPLLLQGLPRRSFIRFKLREALFNGVEVTLARLRGRCRLDEPFPQQALIPHVFLRGLRKLVDFTAVLSDLRFDLVKLVDGIGGGIGSKRQGAGRARNSGG